MMSDDKHDNNKEVQWPEACISTPWLSCVNGELRRTVLPDVLANTVMSYSYHPIRSFSDLPYSPELLQSITQYYIREPSGLQQHLLPLLCSGDNDVVLLAKSGQGAKTACGLHALHVAEQTMSQSGGLPRVLILDDTDFHAGIVSHYVSQLGKSTQVRCATVQANAAANTHAGIIVGSPDGCHSCYGAEHDLCTVLSTIRFVIVLRSIEVIRSDGAPEALLRIARQLPASARWTWIYSDRRSIPQLPDAKLIQKLCGDRLPRVYHHKSLQQLPTLSGVAQFYVDVQPEQEPDVICKLSAAAPQTQLMVFCPSRRLRDWLAEQLRASVTVGLIGVESDAASRFELKANDRRIWLTTDVQELQRCPPHIITVIYHFPHSPDENTECVARAEDVLGDSTALCICLLALGAAPRLALIDAPIKRIDDLHGDIVECIHRKPCL